MRREDAHEGQRVRVKIVSHEARAGQEGVVIQIWPHDGYKWYEWATVEFADGDTAHIEYEHLDAVSEGKQA